MTVEVLNRTASRLPASHFRSVGVKLASLLRRRGFWKGERYTVHLIFVPDRVSRVLNARFRRRYRPADVLTFDYGTFGELLLAPRFIRREARLRGQSFTPRVIGLIAHGMIHLAGVHHERSPSQAERFDRIERQLLTHLKIRNPKS